MNGAGVGAAAARLAELVGDMQRFRGGYQVSDKQRIGQGNDNRKVNCSAKREGTVNNAVLTSIPSGLHDHLGRVAPERQDRS